MNNRGGQRHEITGLRALAVLSVIVFHFAPGLLPGGFLGVDVFFVISGYVITYSLRGYSPTGLGSFLLEFYRRRLKRLMPALVLVVLISAMAIALVDPNPKHSLATGVAAMFGFSNILLMIMATDYFAAATEFNVFTHTWSLGVEEQFYFLYPILAWALLVRKSSDGRRLVATIGLLSVVSFVLFVWLTLYEPSAGFFLMPTRFWELGIGCMICLTENRAIRNLKAANWLSSLALLLVLLGLLIPDAYSIYSTPLVVLATALLITTMHERAPLFRVLTHSVAIWIGLVSYSLYLWHWPVLALSRWTIDVTPWTAPFQLAVMFALAAVSYHFVESPLRRARWSASAGGAVLVGLCAATVSALAVGVLWMQLASSLYLGDPRQNAQGTSSAWLDRRLELAQASRELADACNLTPHRLTGSKWRPAPVVDQDFLGRCLKPELESSKIVLLGDSFASRTTEHLALIADDLKMGFGILIGYGCPYPLQMALIEGAPRSSCPLVDEMFVYENILSSLNHGDIVVLRLHLPKDQYLRYPGRQLPSFSAYDDALLAFARDLHARGAGLMMMGANATLSVQHVQSLSPQWFNRALYTDTLSTSENKETAYFHGIDPHLQSLFANTDTAEFFSVKPYLCTESGSCATRTDNDVYYLDGTHLSPRAYDLFSDDLKLALVRLRNTIR